MGLLRFLSALDSGATPSSVPSSFLNRLVRASLARVALVAAATSAVAAESAAAGLEAVVPSTSMWALPATAGLWEGAAMAVDTACAVDALPAASTSAETPLSTLDPLGGGMSARQLDGLRAASYSSIAAKPTLVCGSQLS